MVKLVVMYTRWVPLAFTIHNTEFCNSSDYAMALFYNECHAPTVKPLKSAGIFNWGKTCVSNNCSNCLKFKGQQLHPIFIYPTLILVKVDTYPVFHLPEN